MIKYLKRKYIAWKIGFDYYKYWSVRDKLFNLKRKGILYFIYSRYIKKLTLRIQQK